ncbi:MAG: hypothetical protein ABIH71_02650 [Candidatus Omnitrophota bacterium]
MIYILPVILSRALHVLGKVKYFMRKVTGLIFVGVGIYYLVVYSF